jgi:phosphoribosyl 1,2-cyclic phosphate phosphodiesterase
MDIIIDTSAEFRLRALEYKIRKIDALLMTHGHADHIAGLDDIRIYNELQLMSIPLYGDKHTLEEIRRRFSYIFEQSQEGGGKPKVDLLEAAAGNEFMIGPVRIKPLLIYHGSLEILGYKINDKFAYITDCSRLPQTTMNEIKGVQVLVLNALRQKPHPTHFTLNEALAAAKESGAKSVYFTHIAHAIEHNEIQNTLPENISLAYDGLEVEL